MVDGIGPETKDTVMVPEGRADRSLGVCAATCDRPISLPPNGGVSILLAWRHGRSDPHSPAPGLPVRSTSDITGLVTEFDAVNRLRDRRWAARSRGMAEICAGQCR
jgi:hypothetical protein